LELCDDGRGFKVKDRHDGWRECASGLNKWGQVEITSSGGKGTKITVLLPCNGEDFMTSKRKQPRVQESCEEIKVYAKKRRKVEIRKALDQGPHCG
jgi:hypothetical protein